MNFQVVRPPQTGEPVFWLIFSQMGNDLTFVRLSLPNASRWPAKMESDLDRKRDQAVVVLVLGTATLIMSVGFLVLG